MSDARGLDLYPAVKAVLEDYHRRIAEERARVSPREEEAEDAHKQRFMAVGPETGRLLNLLVRSLDAPRILELGTSFGYSTIWLADAARATGSTVTTMELYDHKSAHAQKMVAQAGLSAQVEVLVGDALEMIEALPGQDGFVLLDHWKPIYLPSFERLKAKLVPGSILVADDMVRGSDAGVTDDFARAVRGTPGMSSVLLPVGSGVEVSRYAPEQA